MFAVRTFVEPFSNIFSFQFKRNALIWLILFFTFQMSTTSSSTLWWFNCKLRKLNAAHLNCQMTFMWRKLFSFQLFNCLTNCLLPPRTRTSSYQNLLQPKPETMSLAARTWIRSTSSNGATIWPAKRTMWSCTSTFEAAVFRVPSTGTPSSVIWASTRWRISSRWSSECLFCERDVSLKS